MAAVAKAAELEHGDTLCSDEEVENDEEFFDDFYPGQAKERARKKTHVNDEQKAWLSHFDQVLKEALHLTCQDVVMELVKRGHIDIHRNEAYQKIMQTPTLPIEKTEILLVEIASREKTMFADFLQVCAAQACPALFDEANAEFYKPRDSKIPTCCEALKLWGQCTAKGRK